MPSRPPLIADRPRRLWSSRLWVLALVLGATTVYTGASAIHDTNKQHTALGLVTQATAMHVSALASARLERLALEGFAPAGPVAPAAPGPGAGAATIDLLARRQRAGQACACRELLPVSHFFHFDAASGTVDIVPVDTSAITAAAPDQAILAEIARGEAGSVRTISTSSSRIIPDPRLGARSVVTLVQRDDRGSTIAVY